MSSFLIIFKKEKVSEKMAVIYRQHTEMQSPFGGACTCGDWTRIDRNFEPSILEQLKGTIERVAYKKYPTLFVNNNCQILQQKNCSDENVNNQIWSAVVP